MRLWFDVLTPKQVLFFEPMVERLRKGHEVLCTSREYRECTELARLRGFEVENVGRHGGGDRAAKLAASLARMGALQARIQAWGPDLAVSLCSPEAARVAFGLGIRHVTFCNAPHATFVLRLVLPLVDRLLAPWVVPHRAFTPYGIARRRIVSYRALDEYVIVKAPPRAVPLPAPVRRRERLVLVRPPEVHAAYLEGRRFETAALLRRLAASFPACDVAVLPRYADQIRALRAEAGDRVTVIDEVVDGAALLAECDVFVGTGGTMTQEAALRGVPTLSYEAVPNADERYLVRQGLVERAREPDAIVRGVGRLLAADREARRHQAEALLAGMEDPYRVLAEAIASAPS